MNEALQKLEVKVENEGATPQGRLSSAEWNIVVSALKAIDAGDGGLGKDAILKAVREAGYVTRSDVNTIFSEDAVRVSVAQNVSAQHNFTNGIKINNLAIFQSQGDTIFIDANLVVRGGFTARGTNTTTTPSLFDALPIDSRTIKRDTNGMLYVDETALNISGGGGVADSVSWENVTGKPTWIGSTKPTYTPQEIGALGVLDTALNSLSLGGYTHDNYLRWESSGGVSVDLNQVFDFSVKSVQNGAMNYPSASPYGVLLSLPYRNASGNTIPYYGTQLFFACGDDALPNAYWRDSYGSEYKNWRTFLDSSNYSNYALPITGGTVHGHLWINSGTYITNRASLILNSTNAPADIIFKNNSTTTGDYGYWTISSRSGEDGRFSIFRGGENANNPSEGELFVINANGTFALGGSASIYGNLLVIGGLTTRNTSDRRLKKNIRNISASEMLMSLGGVYEFEYIDCEVEKNHIYGGSHIGLIYQNVVGSALNRMCYEREDGYGSLNYLEPSFISLIAGATMENTSEIEVLKKRVKSLEQRM